MIGSLKGRSIDLIVGNSTSRDGLQKRKYKDHEAGLATMMGHAPSYFADCVEAGITYFDAISAVNTAPKYVPIMHEWPKWLKAAIHEIRTRFEDVKIRIQGLLIPDWDEFVDPLEPMIDEGIITDLAYVTAPPDSTEFLGINCGCRRGDDGETIAVDKMFEEGNPEKIYKNSLARYVKFIRRFGEKVPVHFYMSESTGRVNEVITNAREKAKAIGNAFRNVFRGGLPEDRTEFPEGTRGIVSDTHGKGNGGLIYGLMRETSVASGEVGIKDIGAHFHVEEGKTTLEQESRLVQAAILGAMRGGSERIFMDFGTGGDQIGGCIVRDEPTRNFKLAAIKMAVDSLREMGVIINFQPEDPDLDVVKNKIDPAADDWDSALEDLAA